MRQDRPASVEVSRQDAKLTEMADDAVDDELRRSRL